MFFCRKLDGSPCRCSWRQHTDEVLRGLLGHSDAEIQALRDQGVLYR